MEKMKRLFHTTGTAHGIYSVGLTAVVVAIVVVVILFFGQLPEKYRIVIHLFYYEDYTVHEIADILRITESNVKVRLSRGRGMLKETLREEWEDDE